MSCSVAPTPPLVLQLAGSDAVWAGLQGEGLEGDGLALAFVAETARLNVEATVFAHEGRHASASRTSRTSCAREDVRKSAARAQRATTTPLSRRGQG